MKNDELLSKTVSFLRFPLIVGVVFIHFNLTNGFLVRGVRYGLDCPEWAFGIINLFSEVLPRIAVPLFFLMSGFLFFYRADFNAEVYKKKLRTRAWTLLIPFILWNTINILYQAMRLIPALSPIFPNAFKTEMQFSLIRILKTFFANFKNEGIFISPLSEEMTEVSNNPFPIDVPLWYVRDLMVVVILSPVIYWIIKRWGKWFVAASGIIWMLSKAVLWPNGSWCYMLSVATFFFSWGAYYSINRLDFVEQMRKYKYAPWGYLIFAIADLLTKKAAYNIYIHNAGILLGIAAMVILVAHLLESGKVKVNNVLVNSSFFVFALHIIIMRDIGRVAFTVLHLPDTPFTIMAMYFTVPLITIGICIAAYTAIRRFFPTLCNALTGGR